MGQGWGGHRLLNGCEGSLTHLGWFDEDREVRASGLGLFCYGDTTLGGQQEGRLLELIGWEAGRQGLSARDQAEPEMGETVRL